MGPLLEVEAGFLYLLEIRGFGAGCRNCRHKVRSIFFALRFYLSEQSRFSVIQEKKSCNKHMSLYMEEIIFVTNQEASGRRDRTYTEKRVTDA
jgi:hypothetical protein